MLGPCRIFFYYLVLVMFWFCVLCRPGLGEWAKFDLAHAGMTGGSPSPAQLGTRALGTSNYMDIIQQSRSNMSEPSIPILSVSTPGS